MPVAYPLNEARRIRIINLYEELSNVSEVVRRSGIPRKPVERVLRQNGTEIRFARVHRGKFPLEIEVEIMKKYQAGAYASQLAREYDCAIWTIQAMRKRHGVALGLHGHRKRFTPEQISEMKALYETCGTVGAVATRLRLAPETVRVNLVEAGAVPERRRQAAELSPRWKGGRPKTRHDGYQSVYLDVGDPLAAMRNRNGYVLEHRLVMARHLCRVLSPHESVHHINGQTNDNRIENLQLRNGRHGKGVALRCNSCGSHDIVHALLEAEH